MPVFGVGEENGLGYYVMQFIQGLALDEVLDELKRMKRRPSSSSVTADVGLAAAKPREVSAADIARSLIDGELRLRATEEPYAADEERRIDETVDHQPGDVNQPGYPLAGAAVASPQTAATSSAATARQSDTSSGSNPSVNLPGGSGGMQKRSRRWTYWQSVAQIGVQVAEALHYAHGQGILHRDIKPSNLLLDLRGTVWVTDFGLAKLDDDRGLTQTGDILGTLRYLAPETLKQHADARSEIYSLGLTLYELLALRPAFEHVSRHALIDQVLNAEIEPLSKRNPEIPRDLETIVHKTIERDPRHRYQTAQEMADDLRRFIDDEPIHARRLSTFEHVVRWSRHNRGLAASLAVVSMLVIVLAIGSTIAAGYFRSVGGRLSNTVVSLQATQRELHENVAALNTATGEAQKTAAENLRLANAAQQNLRKAEAAEEEGRRLLYTTDMRLAPFVWKDERSTGEQLRALLARHEPAFPPRSAGAAKEDLRGFEWHYYKHLLEDSARVFQGHNVPLVDAALASNGELTTLDQNSHIRRWDPETRAEDEARRLDLANDRNVQVAVVSPDGRFAAVAVGAKVHVLDAATGEDVFQLDSANVPTRGLIFSRDAGWLVMLDDQIRWCDTPP